MIATRRATLRDVDAIIKLALISLAVDPLPVKIDGGAMMNMTAAMIRDNSQFVRVAEVDGKVVAVVGVSCSQGFWFYGQQASMLLFWSTHTGAAIPLMRELARWIKSRPIIKLAVIECEPHIDQRAIKFIRRLGFTRESVNLVYVR